MLKFVILPVVIGIIGGVGSGIRFYRTIFLEEVNRDYVRTARAKGLSEGVVLFKHILKNAMIPILTNVVLVIPLLFMGSLVMEAFFRYSGAWRFYDRSHPCTGFRYCAKHGLYRFCAVYCRFITNRHQLHAG